jgi:hypothetical protein
MVEVEACHLRQVCHQAELLWLQQQMQLKLDTPLLVGILVLHQ